MCLRWLSHAGRMTGRWAWGQSENQSAREEGSVDSGVEGDMGCGGLLFADGRSGVCFCLLGGCLLCFGLLRCI